MKAERKRLCKLEARYKALFDKHAAGDVQPDIAAKMERIEAAVEALQKEAFAPRDLALAGAFVTLAHDGSVRIDANIRLVPNSRNYRTGLRVCKPSLH